MSTPPRDSRQTLFWLLTTVCAVVAILYVVAVRQRAVGTAASPPALSSSVAAAATSAATLSASSDASAPSAPAEAPPSEPPLATERPHPSASLRFAALTMSTPESVGTIMFASTVNVDRRRETLIPCERLHFSRERGICLRREIHAYSAQTAATLLDADLHPLFTVRVDGIPSPARVSADSRYAAFTTFVTGHSYGDAQLSTATLLLETATGSTVANLEQFVVTQNGKILQAADFNYWGVTFARDSNIFYATLRTSGLNYLVRGNISEKSMTVIYKGVECPSLSPDETRVAFKRLIAPVNWRLVVLDLSSLQETPLAETRSVDDQVEWLDNDHVLYAMPDEAPAMGVSILSVPADGAGRPQLFARGVASPAIIR